jgi:glycosyltransferase involved in cell wall biosynthesis
MAMATRVLYSFPHKIGAGRICRTAWYQAAGASRAGADVTVRTGVLHRPLPAPIRTHTTLARGRWRIPYGAIGPMRALALHDRLVARELPRHAGEIDVVHAWPLAAAETLKAARRLGIPTVLERPNAHTRFAMFAVAEECRRLGVELPPDHEHAYNEAKLRKEELEYELADRLLCPSDFVLRTFEDQGFKREQLLRHTYGYDEQTFHPSSRVHDPGRGLEVVFVGVCAVRKGVHHALKAWLRSSASATGRFRIAGEFLPEYGDKLAAMLSHPSVEVLGHRDDVPELLRDSDLLLLPSIEEGSPLTCLEAIGSGCVPLVSEACTGVCVHERNSLVHAVGDVDSLTAHLDLLDGDRGRLLELREACLAEAPELTWWAAGRRLADAYAEAADAAAAPARAAS